MLTTKDIKLLIDNFITREEFNQAMARLEEKLATKEGLNKVMNTVDAVLGEVKAMRMEQSAHFQQHEDINEKFNQSEKRIKKLETTVYHG